MFGAGGGTSSYAEIEETDFILLWGSNAREAHPIFFHHLLKGIKNGAQMYCVDPRYTASAEFADVWMGLNVGSDVALANGVAREIIAWGLHNKDFIEHATTGFEEFRASVEMYTLEETSRITGVPAEQIASLARSYATAETAQLMWTLGITEHLHGVDNVLALCNLSLLTGHVGRWGSGLVPLRGQNNVQGGGDMGALPNKLPGFQDIDDDGARAKFEARWGIDLNPNPGLHLSLMFEAMDEGRIKGLYIVGENPAQSEADAPRARRILSNLDILVVQDIFLTKTAELADVVFPASAGWAESEGTVTNSERRVQRVRRAKNPPGEARDDLEIITTLANRMGAAWPALTPEEVWNELRDLSPLHQGMSWDRLEEKGGIQWPCPDIEHPGSAFLHGRLWNWPVEGRRAPFVPVEHIGPRESLTDEFPLRLTTGRVLDSYNTGVQSGGFNPPIRHGETIDLSAADMQDLDLVDGESVLVSSARGSIEMTARMQTSLRKGLVFTTFHFPDDVDVNVLTNDAWDRKSGTAEFKATSIRIDKRTASGNG